MSLSYGGGGAWTPAKLSGYAAEWDFAGTLPAKRNLAVATHATTNLLIAPEGNFAAVGNYIPWSDNTGGSVTDYFAADPNGGNNASRLVCAGTGYVGQLASASSSGKTVTLSVWMKANTGSPSIKLGIQDSIAGLTYSSNFAITNSWVQYSYTITLSVSGKVSAVYIKDTGSGSDVLVYGAQLEEASSPSVYVPAQWDLQNNTIASSAVQNTGWVAYENANAFAEAVTATSTTTSKFVFAALVKQTADNGAGYVPVACFPGNDNNFICAGEYADWQDAAQIYFGTVRAKAVAPLRGSNSGAGNWRILVCWCDGTSLFVSLEGTIVRKVAWAGSSATFKRMVISRINGIMPGPIDFARGILATDCSASFATGQLPNLVTYLKNDATNKSLTVCPGNAIAVYFGDSFGDPALTTGNQVYYTSLRVTPVLYDSMAVSGASWTGGTTYATQRANFLAQYTNLSSLAHSVVVLAFGQNDLNAASDQSATLLTEYAAAYTQLKADGVKKIVAVPPWSRNVGAFQTTYDTARANFRSGLVIGIHCDYVTPTSSFISANGSFTTNPTYYIADGSHLSIAVGSQEADNTIGPTIATAAAA